MITDRQPGSDEGKSQRLVSIQRTISLRIRTDFRSVTMLLFGVILLTLGTWLAGLTIYVPGGRSLVVYCSHDAEYAEPILKAFEAQTGIPVVIRFDSEATKTLGLVNLLLGEKSAPRCDVFWCNEPVSLLRLKEQGCLTAYRGPGYARIPAQFKDPEGYWTGFAARMRVMICNRIQVADLDQLRADGMWNRESLKDLAIAKPLFGTTFVHYTILTEEWGLDRLKAWHAEIHGRGIVEVNGNAVVKNLVVQGACAAGWTDSDDYFVALDAKQPVTMLPVRLNGKTICIPNAVALISGSQHPAEAQQLIEYLLTAETELKLSQSPARQIPLGVIDNDLLSDEVRKLAEGAREGFDLRHLEKSRKACLKWLTSEYVGI